MPILLIIALAALLALIFGPSLWAKWTLQRYRGDRRDIPGTGGELARREVEENWPDPPPLPIYSGTGRPDFDYEAYTVAVGYGRVRLLTLEEFTEANRQGIYTFQDILVIPGQLHALVPRCRGLGAVLIQQIDAERLARVDDLGKAVVEPHGLGKDLVDAAERGCVRGVVEHREHHRRKDRSGRRCGPALSGSPCGWCLWPCSGDCSGANTC